MGSVNRRTFLSAAGAGASGAWPAAAAPESAQFLWPRNQAYLNSAGLHPISVATRKAIDRVLDYQTQGPGPGRQPVDEETADHVRSLYARLIHAQPHEIAFIQSTQVAENIVTDGLGLPEAGGNIVTDEFHFHGGLYHLKELEQQGVELRIVKPRNWRIELADLERAVDRHTKLVSLTLVSNTNGFVHDAKAVADLAHAHGAYFYADVIQAAGCMPLDVRASGIDFCGAATYKWLMGLHGFGYLYVREELHERLRTRRYGSQHYRNFEYKGFPTDTSFSWDPAPGAAKYEIGSFSDLALAAQHESLGYLLETGVARIQKQVFPLTSRIRREVAALGYQSMTPEESPAPIASFLLRDPEATAEKLRRANVIAKVKWGQLRISPSIFNTQQDVDRLLEALA
ncbi:MAG: aminotransferase class V-fold PLP-dependent enzyme [Bryobacterales bacterium]